MYRFAALRHYVRSLTAPSIRLDEVVARKQGQSEAELEAALTVKLRALAGGEPTSRQERLDLLMDMAWTNPMTRKLIEATKGQKIAISISLPGRGSGEYNRVNKKIRLGESSNILQ